MLRINHYKPGKQLKKEIRDASLTPLGLAIHAEILRAYNRPAVLQNSTHLTQAGSMKKGGSGKGKGENISRKRMSGGKRNSIRP